MGVISLEDALGWALTGPVLRASGIRWDLRKVMPYDGYEQYEFDIPIGRPGGIDEIPEGVVVGDCWSRYYVRVLEMVQSVRIVRQALDRLPPGDFRAPKSVAKYVAAKGSICIDGVSLTVNQVQGNEFEVNLIPHTLKVTTLSRLKAGSEVNMEADLVARYVEGLSARK